MWTTRYIGIAVYGAVASLVILKDLVEDVQEAILLLAPIAVFIAADQLKHRNDTK